MEEEILNRIVSVIESEDMTCDEVRCVINAIRHSQPSWSSLRYVATTSCTRRLFMGWTQALQAMLHLSA